MHTKQTLQHNCSTCSKNFQNAGRLVYHQKTMHKKWTCKLCPKSFPQQWKRNDHERKTHIKEEPQKCKHCEYVSCRPGYLSRHIKRHGSDSEMQSIHYAAIPLKKAQAQTQNVRNKIDELMMTIVQTHSSCVIAKLFIVYDVLQCGPLHCDKIDPT